MSVEDVDEYALEDIAHAHNIDAGMFIPFVIARLGGEERAREAMLSVRLRDIGEAGERVRILRLTWSLTSVPSESSPLQEREVTEYAACGIACVLMAFYTPWQITRVARVGERFDYWVTDSGDEGLEISGTTVENLERLHREKTQQLLSSPRGVDGYVTVVNFTTREAIFSFHRVEEGLQ